MIVVSHNMAEVERMCDRALWLDLFVVRDGRLGADPPLRTTRSTPTHGQLLDDESGRSARAPMDLRALRELVSSLSGGAAGRC